MKPMLALQFSPGDITVVQWRMTQGNLSRFAGVSEAGVRRRNPEQSEGSLNRHGGREWESNLRRLVSESPRDELGEPW
jgi:hypothetical protein